MELTPDSLSPAQQIAVTAPLASRLVLAGPGTGKTRTLVFRVAHLISKLGIAPENILAVTYTNKATEEMRARLRTMLPEAAAHLSVGTFHAFCIRLLREHHAAVGLPKHFAVTDEKGQRAVLRRVRPNLAEFDEKRILSALSKHMLSEELEGEPLPESLVETFEAYRATLRRNALIDFDDILLLAEQLLLDSPEALDAVRARFKAVLVDEFQDTDAVQYRILKLICLGALPGVHRDVRIPVFAVADDDQSIFAWRGADPRNVSRFTADFLADPEEDIVKLEENYRCSGSIVGQANRLLSRTPRLFDKTPTAANAKGEPVRLDIYANDADEAAGVAGDIRAAHARGVPFSEMAVLYRQHSIGAEFERTLLKAGIPCQVVRGATLFDEPRVRRLLLLMRVLANPNDDPSFAEFLAATCDEPTRLRVDTAARSKNTTLRAGLSARLRANDSDRAERRQLSRVAGALSTAKTLIESQPPRTLTEWTRNLDTYLAESSALSTQHSALEISDPLATGPIEMAARWFERLAVRGGTLVLAAGDAVIERAAVALLETLLAAPGFAIRSERTLETEKIAEPLVLLALDSAGEARATEARKFSAVLAMPDFALGAPGRSGARREVPPDCVPANERGPRPSVFATLWKIAQGFLGLRLAPFLPNYTVVDIETTDLDTERNDMVEVAAVRVRDGQPTETFSSLVKPVVPISADAAAVHKITSGMVIAQPGFADIAAEFRDFLGDDTLVAHNGLGFDFPILMRRLRESGKKLDNPLFDTLPLARRLYPDAKKATLESLAAKFGVDTGAAHRALDDTKTLAQVFEAMKADYAASQRTLLGTEQLGCLALTMLLEMSETEAEQSALYRAGRETWGDETSERFHETLFTEEDEGSDAAVRVDRAWRAAHAAAAKNPERQRANEAFTKFLDVLHRFDAQPLGEAMREALDFTRLFQMQDSWRARDAVTLMTIHAAKGLEFSRVWIPALEQGILPSGKSTRPNDPVRVRKVDEERRLLYVGMTRAMTHLALSWARHRNGMRTMPSEFLVTLALDPVDHTELSGTE